MKSNLKTMIAVILLSLVSVHFSITEAFAQSHDLNINVRRKINTTDVVKGNNRFAVNLYHKLKKSDSNIFFSPYSISTALAMTYAGAREDTEKAMRKTLQLPYGGDKLHKEFSEIIISLNSRSKDNYQLSVANRLWLASNLKASPSFSPFVEKFYQAGMEQLNFTGNAEGSRQTINSWVEKKTNSKIKDLIPQGVLGAQTEFVITNAIYFFGNWQTQFNEKTTSDQPFYITPKKQTPVKLMYQEKNFRYAAADGMQILAMPYKGGDLSMVIILPEKKGNLPEIEKKLTAETLEDWISRMNTRKVKVYFPKFKITCTENLNAPLQSMGMQIAFTNAANFKGISPTAKIGAVLHKAFIEVNEKGTEAAAATAVIGITKTSINPEPPPIIFRADHPFIYLIRDEKTGSILFMGKMHNPKT